MNPLNEKPEQHLTQLFLKMFSADELRRLLRYSFPDELTLGLPGANASPVALAEAASQALLHRDDLATLWPRLVQERPRRQAEIEAVRDLFPPPPTNATTSTTTPTPTTGPIRGSGSGSGHGPEKAGPIRVLFVLSCPPGQKHIDTGEELRRIRAEFRLALHRDHFTHEVITAATFDDLRRTLLDFKPHILHLACHGTLDAALILSDGHGDEEHIETATFVELLDVLKDDLRLVVLNACYSAEIAKELVAGIGLVLGMRGVVNDRSAIAFAAVFYTSLAAGRTVEQSFRLGVNELRRLKTPTDTAELLPLEGPQRQRRFVSP